MQLETPRHLCITQGEASGGSDVEGKTVLGTRLHSMFRSAHGSVMLKGTVLRE